MSACLALGVQQRILKLTMERPAIKSSTQKIMWKFHLRIVLKDNFGAIHIFENYSELYFWWTFKNYCGLEIIMYASQARLPIYLEIYVILLRRLEEYTTHRYILTIHNITSHSHVIIRSRALIIYYVSICHFLLRSFHHTCSTCL